MAKVFDFSAISRQTPRAALLAQLQEDPNYAWVTGLLEEETDEYVAKNLRRPIPIQDQVIAGAQRFAGRYNPAYIADNLASASDLLDRALLRRTEIQGLESQSITLALQYLLEDKQRDDQFKIARLHALNAISGSGQEPDGYLKALDRQRLTQQAAHLARLKTHLTEGGALNFTQRVNHLRLLYLTDVKEALARLAAVDLAIRRLIGSIPTLSWPALPSIDGNAGDLPRLIAWAREVTGTYSALRQREREEVHSVELGDCVQGLQHLLNLTAESNEKVPITFTIRKEALWPGRRVVAILGVDVVMRSGVATVTHLNSADKTYVFTDDQETRNEGRRRTHTTSARIALQPPTQGSGADDQWSSPPVYLSAVALHSEGRSQDYVSFGESAHLGRVDPDGLWTLTLDRTLDQQYGTVQLSTLLGVGQDEEARHVSRVTTDPSLVSIKLYFRCLCL